ncbi:aminotransferase [Podospora didyma]|uniref:Aminotransferase n=1 Tax=Podospora didyma TaxID=330526 RepID=A0AAE0P0I2_9PEZI|nr:aminotransferase [Podospora didyma]
MIPRYFGQACSFKRSVLSSLAKGSNKTSVSSSFLVPVPLSPLLPRASFSTATTTTTINMVAEAGMGASGNDTTTKMTQTTTTTTTDKNNKMTKPNMTGQHQQQEQQKKKKKLINLIRGWPSPHLLPADLLAKASARVLSDPGIFVPALQYAPDPGYQPLREELARWLRRAYFPSPDSPLSGGGSGGGKEAENICITGGASQSIACLLQSFTDPGYTRAVWAVAPCYFLACPIFEDAGFKGRLRGVPEDEEGVDLGFLRRGLEGMRRDEDEAPGLDRKIYRHVIYVVPTSANPSGKTMSLRRREGLVKLAREFDALVICDDVYDFLQWPPLLPRLSDIDLALGRSPFDPPGKVFGHAVSNGSFSKLIGPGMRTGWTHSTPDFALGVSKTGSTRSGGAPSQLAAAMIHQMLASGDLDRHLDNKVRPALQARHAAVVQAVKQELGGGDLGVQVLEEGDLGKGMFGGYFLWLTLPEGGPDAATVAEWAKQEENLIVAEGAVFEVIGQEGGEAIRFPRNIRICYSWEEEEDVVEGVKRLERVLRRVRDKPADGRKGGESKGWLNFA